MVLGLFSFRPAQRASAMATAASAPRSQQGRFLPALWQGTRHLEASTRSLLLLCSGISW